MDTVDERNDPGEAPGSPSSPTPRQLQAEYHQKRKALLESFARQLTQLNNEYRQAVRQFRTGTRAAAKGVSPETPAQGGDTHE